LREFLLPGLRTSCGIAVASTEVGVLLFSFGFFFRGFFLLPPLGFLLVCTGFSALVGVLSCPVPPSQDTRLAMLRKHHYPRDPRRCARFATPQPGVTLTNCLEFFSRSWFPPYPSSRTVRYGSFLLDLSIFFFFVFYLIRRLLVAKALFLVSSVFSSSQTILP